MAATAILTPVMLG